MRPLTPISPVPLRRLANILTISARSSVCLVKTLADRRIKSLQPILPIVDLV